MGDPGSGDRERADGLSILMLNYATGEDFNTFRFALGWIESIALLVKSVEIVSYQAGKCDLPPNVKVHGLNEERFMRPPSNPGRFLALIWDLTKTRSYDVCFCHMAVESGAWASPILWLRGIPMVLWYAHKGVSPYLRVAHGYSDRVVSTNRLSFPLRSEKVTPVGQGIDTKTFYPEFGKTDMECVSMVGRVAPIKNVLCAVAAIGILRSKGIKVKLKVVGPFVNPSYLARVRHEIGRKGLQDAVSLDGERSPQGLAEVYRESLCHWNCTPSDHSVDKTCLEAMACGCVTFSSCNSIVETYGGYASMFHFRENEAMELAEKFLRFISLPGEQRLAVRCALADRTRAMHDVRGLGARLVRVFEDTKRARMPIDREGSRIPPLR